MAKLCPICAKPLDLKNSGAGESAPFCSRRCADVDLHRWLSESYAIPVVEHEDEDGDNPALASPPSPGRKADPALH
ncbi:DNA gyrase inhibitor YacG [Ferrovibrio sp.]|uniref:DNA gyrase inhibitor YacG n=1 Tax=Ferrovibrio sp. TaxID=1917215 RepID=UPI0025C60D91|nr:DNA gyrase inhibitor YacG [Ferrovibrio sp.]MBX3453880.1 DNA gyrase inhibitor YacG [Ferrovibrio sp.]